MTHCCEEMNYHIENEELYLNYNPICRCYSINYQEIYAGCVRLINFCPWCGSKFPSNLTDTLCQIAHDQYGAEAWDDPDLPEEFKSDEWWKNRKL